MSKRSIFSMVPREVVDAVYEMSSKLRTAEIPHVLIGGLAVNAYARPRSTRDIDFLVSSSSQTQIAGRSLIVGKLFGVTLKINEVYIDRRPRIS